VTGSVSQHIVIGTSDWFFLFPCWHFEFDRQIFVKQSELVEWVTAQRADKECSVF
jgi:hypothetical protein